MYALRVADFLPLEVLLPHEEMQARGLVVPLSMDGEHKLASMFTSSATSGSASATQIRRVCICAACKTLFAEQS
jgi:hypothetical protein